MKLSNLRSGLATLLGATVLVGLAASDKPASAADHLDPSPRVGDPVGNSADIADLFAWHQNNRMTIALTFAGPLPAAMGQDGAYDRDVLYGIHIDSADSDFDADQDIWVRFGQNSANEWGVRVENLPGAAGGPVVGMTGQTLDAGSSKVFTGLREDPFFFDLQGFRDTLMSAKLSFDSTRDFFKQQNVTSIVVEFDVSALSGSGPFRVWATTARAGG